MFVALQRLCFLGKKSSTGNILRGNMYCVLIVRENFGPKLLYSLRCKNFLSGINTDMKWENGKAPSWKIMHKKKTGKIHMKKKIHWPSGMKEVSNNTTATKNS